MEWAIGGADLNELPSNLIGSYGVRVDLLPVEKVVGAMECESESLADPEPKLPGDL